MSEVSWVKTLIDHVLINRVFKYRLKDVNVLRPSFGESKVKSRN